MNRVATFYQNASHLFDSLSARVQSSRIAPLFSKAWRACPSKETLKFHAIKWIKQVGAPIQLAIEWARIHLYRKKDQKTVVPLDKEALNRLSTALQQYGIHTNLENGELNLSGLLKNHPLKEDILALVFKSSCIRALDLCDNDLTKLPATISGMTTLTRLNLSMNSLKKLPREIGSLSCLELLSVGKNFLDELPSDISKLSSLKELYLQDNLLTELPNEIGLLQNLETVNLGINRLEELPKEIGQLEQLKELSLWRNQLRTLPSTIRNCRQLVLLNLTQSRLLPRSPLLNEWGEEELKKWFGVNTFRYEKLDDQAMNPWTEKRVVYAEMKMAPLHLGSQFFRVQMAEISTTVLSYEKMRERFEHLINSLNLESISTEEILGERIPKRKTNSSIFNEKIRPKLFGYITALYKKPRIAGEVSPEMMMYDHLLEETKVALSYMLENCGEDQDTRALRFTQLLKGLLACFTGQSEALNVVLQSIASSQAITSDLEASIQSLIATQKNIWFIYAILSKGIDNTHFSALYRDKLKVELGLSYAVKNYQEHVGYEGFDPFRGNEWNLLEVYFQIVSASRVVSWVRERCENETDREWKVKRERYLEIRNKKNSALSSNHETLIETIEKNRMEKIALIDELIATVDALSERQTEFLDEMIEVYGENFPELTEMKEKKRSIPHVLENLKIAISQAAEERKLALSRSNKTLSLPTQSEMEYLQQLESELGEQILDRLNQIIENNRRDRPFSSGDLIEFFSKKKTVDFSKAFTRALEDPLSTITDEGIAELLVQMNILERTTA